MLNEDQTFMIENQDLSIIVEKFSTTNEKTILNLDKKQKFEIKENSLFLYLKSRSENNTISDLDKTLYTFLDDEVKSKVVDVSKNSQYMKDINQTFNFKQLFRKRVKNYPEKSNSSSKYIRLS